MDVLEYGFEQYGKIGTITKQYQGTKSIDLGSGNPTNKIGLYTKSQIASLLGINSNFLIEDFVAMVENGDYSANQFVVVGTYFDDDNILYVQPNVEIKGNVRFNFLFSYCG